MNPLDTVICLFLEEDGENGMKDGIFLIMEEELAYGSIKRLFLTNQQELLLIL